MSSDRRLNAPVRMTVVRMAPLLLPFIVLFAGGLAMTVAQSFGYFLPVPPDAAGTSAYAALLKQHYLAAGVHSLWVASASTFLAVSLGTLLACLIWRLPTRLQSLAVVYKVPLILPHIGIAFIILVCWSQSGVLASIAYHLGWIETPGDFPSVIHGGWGAGMILAYVYKEIPFVVILVLAMLKRLDPLLVDTARMLGGSVTDTFRAVILPHIKPALHTSAIILFLYSFGAFDIPFLLSESSPGMLSIEVYNLYFQRELSNRPEAMAILVCMFLFSLAFIVAYTRIAARLDSGERKL